MTPTPLYGLFAILMYIIIALQYKKINKAVFISPLLIQILTFTISFSTVIFLYNQGYINSQDFYILLMQFSIYFFVLMITPYFISSNHSNLSSYMNLRKFDFQMINFIFYINLIIGLTYVLLFWSLYSEGSDRLYFNKDFRVLSLLSILTSISAISTSSAVFSKTKQKKYFIYFIISIILASLMGSRASAIVGIFIFAFFYFHCNKVNSLLIIKIISVVALFLIVPTQIMYGNAFEIIMDRIMMSGDIYLFSYVIGDYTQLIDFYDPISYLMHPFSSIVGIRGYDYPLGAEILSTANLPVTGVGPNDQMPILGLTFFNDCIVCIIIFTLFFSLLIMFFILLAYRIFRETKLHLTIRVIVFTVIYIQVINIFIGVNAFSFNIIIGVFAICVYFFALFLKDVFNITKRGKEFDKKRK